MRIVKPTDFIDDSWNPIRSHLYNEKITELNTQILPENPYKPHPSLIFRAFALPVRKCKVVILGQDPYPNGNHACGLAFANGTGTIPKSLKIIYKEITKEQEKYGLETCQGGPDIHTWSEQGVMLLNTALTVQTGASGSHSTYWRNFTEATIKFLSKSKPCVWLLWGGHARSFQKYISKPLIINRYVVNGVLNEDMPIEPGTNYVMTSSHPIVESYKSGNSSYYGNNHFHLVNQLLPKLGEDKIIW